MPLLASSRLALTSTLTFALRGGGRPVRTILIDADLLAFQTAAGHEQQIDWGDGVWSTSVDVPFACTAMDERIRGWVEKLGADAVVICISDDVNFRKTLFPGYKGSRSGKRLPTGLGALKDHLASEYMSFIRPGLEADDVMGILSTHPKLILGQKIIVSEDKDMATIPGWLFNPRKDVKARLVTEQEADHFHLYQALIGDTADEYPGCPGVGPVKAAVILSEEPWWPRVVEAFVKKGLTEEDAILQARLARILRSGDYNFQTKEPILWSPPTPIATTT